MSGVRAAALCRDGVPGAALEPPLPDDQRLVLITNDFLATGGEGMTVPAGSVRIEDGPTLRDEIARSFPERASPGALRVSDAFDPGRPRLAFPGERPVRCPAP